MPVSTPIPLAPERSIIGIEAAEQLMEMRGDTTMATAYSARLQRQRTIEAQRMATVVTDINRKTTIAQSLMQGFDNIPHCLDIIEAADRLETMALLIEEYGDAISEQDTVEDEQATREFLLYCANIRANPTPNLTLPTTDMSQTDQEIFQDFLHAGSSAKQDMTSEQRQADLQQTMARLQRVLPILHSAIERNPDIKSDPLFSVFEATLSSVPGMFAGFALDPLIAAQPSSSTETHITAGDWVRYVLQTDSLGADTLIGLARGFTRPVDARDPSDWMSLLWEVAVRAPFSSLIHHDVTCPAQTLISELDRASEILALSYRHRVHGDQTHGLRYRLPECCWAELRLVVEATVAGRPHGRVVLWWDQVLGATAKVDDDGVAWATVGLLPFVAFRVVYNPPGRCASHKPVYEGRADFVDVTDDLDIRRLWVNLEHRLALRGCGLLMSRRAGAEGCELWNVGRVGPKWEGQEHREIAGEENMPMLGIRKIVAHLVREEVGEREVTFPKDMVELQRWGATLAVLPRREWEGFLAGNRKVEREGLTVREVVRMVLRAGAPATLDGGGPLLASAPTVPCARVSGAGGWSGVAEWAPVLREEAVSGWMSESVEREARRELEKFTVWIFFPLETEGREGEAVAIGKLWTPVQAVSSYMVVWLTVETRFEKCRERGMSVEDIGAVYANGQVRKTQLVWPSKVERFHRTFGGVHWALSCVKSATGHKVKYSQSVCMWKKREPQANEALQCRRLPAEDLFSCIVEEWGEAVREHLVSNVKGSSSPSVARPVLKTADGVPAAVMTGEEVRWS